MALLWKSFYPKVYEPIYSCRSVLADSVQLALKSMITRCSKANMLLLSKDLNTIQTRGSSPSIHARS